MALVLNLTKMFFFVDKTGCWDQNLSQLWAAPQSTLADQTQGPIGDQLLVTAYTFGCLCFARLQIS